MKFEHIPEIEPKNKRKEMLKMRDKNIRASTKKCPIVNQQKCQKERKIEEDISKKKKKRKKFLRDEDIEILY